MVLLHDLGVPQGAADRHSIQAQMFADQIASPKIRILGLKSSTCGCVLDVIRRVEGVDDKFMGSSRRGLPWNTHDDARSNLRRIQRLHRMDYDVRK